MKVSRGFTLIELMVSLVVLGVLLALAIPGFSNAFKRHRLIGAAETLMANLNYAKSESSYRSENVVFSLHPAAPWCYGLANGVASCDCSSTTSCMVGGVLKVVTASEFPEVSISSPTADTNTVFTYARGGASAQSIDLSATNGLIMRIVISDLGMIRLCSPAGSNKVFGFEDC